MIRRLLNPSAHTDNIVEMFYYNSGCCLTPPDVCAYVISATGSGNLIDELVSITVTDSDGTSVVIDTSGHNSSIQVLMAYIETQLRALGYAIQKDSPHGWYRFYTMPDGTETLEIWGELVVTGANDGSAITPEARCDVISLCDYEVLYEGGTENPILSVDGDTQAATGTVTYPGNEADLLADINAAMVTLADGDSYFLKSVTDDTDAAAYKITFRMPFGTVVIFDGVTATQCNCGRGFESGA